MFYTTFIGLSVFYRFFSTVTFFNILWCVFDSVAIFHQNTYKCIENQEESIEICEILLEIDVNHKKYIEIHDNPWTSTKIWRNHINIVQDLTKYIIYVKIIGLHVKHMTYIFSCARHCHCMEASMSLFAFYLLGLVLNYCSCGLGAWYINGTLMVH